MNLEVLGIKYENSCCGVYLPFISQENLKCVYYRVLNCVVLF